MYAQIHAVTEEKEGSPGKRTCVSTDNFVLAVVNLPAQNSDDLEKYLELVAESSEWVGTGARGGEDRTVLRKLTLRLSEEDLDEIIRFALKNDLAGAELKSRLRTAHKDLTELAEVMKVPLARRSTRTARGRRTG